MDISNHFSTTKLYGSSVKSVAGTSEKSKWKLTDSLKEKIVELAKKDAQHNVYMGNEFMNLRKAEVGKVAPNRAALMGKLTQSMSGNMSAMKEVEEADMKDKLQTALHKQTVTLSIWTWAFCFICMIQTGYILFVNKDVVWTIPRWFENRWENGCDMAEVIAGLYQWCYGYLTDYMHPYVVIGIMVLVSVGIVAVGFVLLRNVIDWSSEKWHDRWQYYEVYGEIRLRKAVSVALCIVSVTFALTAGKYIPLNINVVSWWLVFSIGLNLMYHSCCKSCY